MTKYKVRISIDEKNFYWIIVENKNIINRNATREELIKITTKVYQYNKTNICQRCRENNNITDKSILFPKNALCERDIDSKIIVDCYRKDTYDRDEKDLFKSLRKRRTGNLNPNSVQAKGDLFQKLTCKWRSTVSTIPVEDLNEKLDNYNSSYDHTRDSGLGIIQTQGRICTIVSHGSEGWGFSNFQREFLKQNDNTICYCISKDGKTIERIYIFPKYETYRMTITIVKNPTKKRYVKQWYEKYRVTDKEIIMKGNEIWININHIKIDS